MEICKAPTLQLKALNKHSINTPNVHQDGNIISNTLKKNIYIYIVCVFQIRNNCILCLLLFYYFLWHRLCITSVVVASVLLFRKSSGDIHLLWSNIISGSLGQWRGEIASSAHRKHRH